MHKLCLILLQLMKAAATAGKVKPKPKIRTSQTWCIFSVVKQEDAAKLLNMQLSTKEEKDLLEQIMPLSLYQEPVKSIMIELYHKALTLGKQRHPVFDEKKISTLLGIFYVTLNKATQKDISQKKFHDIFKNLLLIHSVQRPPHSLCIFSADDVLEIVELFIDDAYRQFHLYRFMFHPRYEMTIDTDCLFKVGLPDETAISNDMKEIKPLEVPDLRNFIQISPEEAEAEARAKEVEEILNVARNKYQKELEEKYKKIEEEVTKELSTLEKK